MGFFETFSFLSADIAALTHGIMGIDDVSPLAEVVIYSVAYIHWRTRSNIYSSRLGCIAGLSGQLVNGRIIRPVAPSLVVSEVTEGASFVVVNQILSR